MTQQTARLDFPTKSSHRKLQSSSMFLQYSCRDYDVAVDSEILPCKILHIKLLSSSMSFLAVILQLMVPQYRARLFPAKSCSESYNSVQRFSNNLVELVMSEYRFFPAKSCSESSNSVQCFYNNLAELVMSQQAARFLQETARSCSESYNSVQCLCTNRAELMMSPQTARLDLPAKTILLRKLQSSSRFLQ